MDEAPFSSFRELWFGTGSLSWRARIARFIYSKLMRNS
jgi:hypothetical protein